MTFSRREFLGSVGIANAWTPAGLKPNSQPDAHGRRRSGFGDKRNLSFGALGGLGSPGRGALG
jgi:hypothetical protein